MLIGEMVEATRVAKGLKVSQVATYIFAESNPVSAVQLYYRLRDGRMQKFSLKQLQRIKEFGIDINKFI